jgi:pyruvate/2-oxoglutarate dehydrogenase complex dihydrolipoamide dehydrogenase (E3) component
MGKGTPYDLVVIGSGAAGSTVATAIAERGYRVALVERGALGGTCLNIGCDPTKTLVRAAQVAHLARTAGRFGIGTGEVTVDWAAVRAHVAGVIDAIRDGDAEQNLRDQGVEVIREHGWLVDGATVVAGDHRLPGDQILIATGARAKAPPIAGLARAGYLTSADMPTLDALPPSIAILGAGPIGVEYAQILARLGVRVTLIGTRDHILTREEPALRDALLDALRDEGIAWEPELRVGRVSNRRGLKVLQGERAGEVVEIEAAEILVATGREPNVDRLGLAEAGVQTAGQGVLVDSRLRTTNPGIYAAGDVTGIYGFTHVADYQARIVEHNLLNPDQPRKVDYRVVPWVTYADPELARVGLTEEEARVGGFDVVTSTVPFADLPRALTMDARTGMVKLVIDRLRGTLLGGHVLGAGAGELIGEIAVAMEARLPVEALARTIHPYPTLSEGIYWAAYQATGHLAASPVRA